MSFTSYSIFFNNEVSILAKWVKSKRRLFELTKEPFWITWSPKIFLKVWCSKWVAVWFLEHEALKVESTTAINLADKFLTVAHKTPGVVNSKIRGTNKECSLDLLRKRVQVI